MVSLLARYLNGEHEQVWSALRAHLSLSGELFEEAQAVANETMHRVAKASDVLCERLADRGWKSLYGALRTRPAETDDAVIERLEDITECSTPLSLLSFWRIVGGISLVWNYDCDDEIPNLGVKLAMETMDPLSVDAPSFMGGELESLE